MGGGSSFSRSKSKSQVVDKQAKEFQALRGSFADLLGGTFGDISSFLSGDLNFEGSGINLDDYRAPMTTGERESLEGLGRLNQPSPNELASRDLLGRTLEGDFLSPENNQGLQDLIRYTNKAINSAYNDEGLAQKALFARAGQELPESSPFADAAARLSAGRLDAIGKNVAGLTSAAYESERGRQVQAVEQTRANADFQFQRQVEFFKASSLPRLIDEIGFDRAFPEFQSRLAALSEALGVIAGVTAPVAGNEYRASAWSGSGSAGYAGSGSDSDD
jgi:hypothetical protein